MAGNKVSSSYSEILESKIVDIENQITEAWDDYQKQLLDLQKIHNDKLAELEKTIKALETFRTASSDNVSLDLLETLENKASELKLSDEEMIIILTRLAKLTSKEEKQKEEVIPQEETKKVTAISNQNNNQKQEVNDIRKEYERLLIDIEKVRENRKLSNYDNIYDKTIMNSGNLNTDEQKIAFDDFVKKGQLYKRNLDSIEDSFLYLKTSVDGESARNILANIKSIKDSIASLKELISQNEELTIEFEIAYEEYNNSLESKKVEEKNDEKINNDVEQVDSDLLDEYNDRYHYAVELLKKYNNAAQKGLINPNENSLINRCFNSLSLMLSYGHRDNINEMEMQSMINQLETTISTIEANVEGALKDEMFNEEDSKNINIGSKSIVIFLDDDGNYLLEENLNSFDSGDRKFAAKSLRNILMNELTNLSWVTDLSRRGPGKLDNLKGVVIKTPAKEAEARNYRCASDCRISIWPVSLNPTIKEKLKQEYNNDELETVLLVGGIAVHHQITEKLLYQIKKPKYKDRIAQIDEMFSNPKTDIEDLKSIIDDSSNLCNKVLSSKMVETRK